MTKSLEKAFAKNKSKKDKDAQGKKSGLSGLPRAYLWAAVGGCIGLILSGIASVVLFQMLVINVEQKQVNELAQEKASVAAKHVQFQLKQIHQKIAFFTSKQGLIEAVAKGDEQALASYQKQIHSQVDGVIELIFYKKGEARRDTKRELPVRFAELDMIQRAERGEQIRPEAAKFDKRWILNFVKPISASENKGSVVGTMLVRMENKALLRGLGDVMDGFGKVVIEQRFKETSANRFVSIGKGNAGDIQEIFISGSHWHVLFTPSGKLVNSLDSGQAMVYGTIAVLILLFAGLGISMGYRVGVRIQERATLKVAKDDQVSVKATGDDDASLPAADILDIDIADEDEDILGFEDSENELDDQAPSEVSVSDEEDDVISGAEVPEVIFRAYDIRGLWKEQVTTKVAQYIGQALGSEALDNNQDTLIVARDARLSSPELTEWLVRGILSTGCNVLNIGTVPTPLMYFATETLQESQSGVMVTASHNPGHYNGFKIVMNGKCRSGDDIRAIRKRIMKGEFYQGSGLEHRHDIVDDYVDTIFSDVALAGDVSIVVDAGNGVTGTVAPRLFEELGCQVTPLFCDLDGAFPNHDPDPSIPENLQALIEKVQDEGADLGVAFDGDGDRLAVVTPAGKIIWPDQLLMLFAKDIVSRNPGADVVFDVKCTRHLSTSITSYGGRPIMWKTGHAPMKSKMQETGALVGGEYSGHIFIKDRWFGFDDGMYAAARLIEILSLQGESLDMMFSDFPQSPNTPEVRIEVGEESKFSIIEQLKETGEFEDAKLTLIDGVRADFPYGWGLIRASNTSAHLTLRFEADDEGSLHHIKSLFVKELRKIDSSIQIDWNV